MRPFETLDRFRTPDGRDLTLHRRDDDWFIHLDGDELMTTRAASSERALAELACRQLEPAGKPRVLIGGLGLGYTLRAALDELPHASEVVVAEVYSAVIAWNRTHLAELQKGAVSDRRVRIVEKDVWHLLGEEDAFDAVLLDVDNGPDAWCLETNGRIYGREGLERIQRCLRPRGILGVWSAQANQAFLKRLRKGGFDARAHGVRGHHGKGAAYTVFLARARR